MSLPEPLSDGPSNATEATLPDGSATQETFIDPGETNAEFWQDWSTRRRQRRRAEYLDSNDEPKAAGAKDAVHHGPWPPTLSAVDSDERPESSNFAPATSTETERVKAEEYQEYWNRWAAMNAQLEAKIRRSDRSSGKMESGPVTAGSPTDSPSGPTGVRSRSTARAQAAAPAPSKAAGPVAESAAAPPKAGTPDVQDRRESRRSIDDHDVQVRVTEDGETMLVGGNTDQDYWQNWASTRRAERKAARAEERARAAEEHRRQVRLILICAIVVVVLTAVVVFIARLVLTSAQSVPDEPVQPRTSSHFNKVVNPPTPPNGVR
jgi:hypothetical protein